MSLLRASLIICTHSPREDYLRRVLASIEKQTLPHSAFELLIIDNASTKRIELNLQWHPHARVIREERIGLTQARLRGIKEAKSSLLIWCDDDNVLDRSYLENAVHHIAREPQLGLLGGKAFPEYEIDPPTWFSDDLAPLACRDLGEHPLRAAWAHGSNREYPSCSPIGAGLVARSEVCLRWADSLAKDTARFGLGRSGKNLSSGEDNDMVMTALEAGSIIGYEPGLTLTHLIPSSRLEHSYLARLAYASSRDWVVVLHHHQICPWNLIPRWSIPFRQLKAWFAYEAWKDPAHHIRWRGACGHFDGLADLYSSKKPSA